ncbi:hypothetical protein D3C71_991030 [compost metagenome]
MLTPEFLPEGFRMYVRDTASFSHTVDGEITWFEKDQLSVGTEVDTEKIYELWRKYQGSPEEVSWFKNRRAVKQAYHEDPMVFGFVGCSGSGDGPSAHVCQIIWHNWSFRTVMLSYGNFGKKRDEDRRTFAWVPNTPEALAMLMQFKLIMS